MALPGMLNCDSPTAYDKVTGALQDPDHARHFVPNLPHYNMSHHVRSLKQRYPKRQFFSWSEGHPRLQWVLDEEETAKKQNLKNNYMTTTNNDQFPAPGPEYKSTAAEISSVNVGNVDNSADDINRESVQQNINVPLPVPPSDSGPTVSSVPDPNNPNRILVNGVSIPKPQTAPDNNNVNLNSYVGYGNYNGNYTNGLQFKKLQLKGSGGTGDDRPKSVRDVFKVEEANLRKQDADREALIKKIKQQEQLRANGNSNVNNSSDNQTGNTSNAFTRLRPGTSAALTKTQKYQKLVQFEGCACRFYAVLHDVYTEAYERRRFSITYFLSDDTCSVEEIAAPNSGRAGFFRTFQKRAKIPRNSYAVGQIGDGDINNNKDSNGNNSNDFINLIDDLSIGKTIRISATDFYIYDCDNWTRRFYKEKLNIILKPSIDMRICKPKWAVSEDWLDPNFIKREDLEAEKQHRKEWEEKIERERAALAKESSTAAVKDVTNSNSESNVNGNLGISTLSDNKNQSESVLLSNQSTVPSSTPRTKAKVNKSSTLKLVEKDDKKIRNIDLDGRVLQWGLKQEGEERKFVLLFYLYDNEIKINSVKSSGYGELDSGSYVKKQSYINPETKQPFTPWDFDKVGKKFVLHSKRFIVDSMNSFTERYLTEPEKVITKWGGAENKSEEELELTLKRLVMSLGKSSSNLQKTFRQFDETKDHVLCFKDFAAVCYHHGFRCNEEDLSRLFRAFDQDQEYQLSFKAFVGTVYESDYPENGNVVVKTVPPFNSDYLDKLRQKVEERDETAEVQRVLRLLSGLVHHRGQKTRDLLLQHFAPLLKIRTTNNVSKEEIFRVFSCVFSTVGKSSLMNNNNNNRGLNGNAYRPQSQSGAVFGAGPDPYYTDEYENLFSINSLTNKDSAADSDNSNKFNLFTQRDVNRCLAYLYPDTWNTTGCDYVQLIADLVDAHHDFAKVRDTKYVWGGDHIGGQSQRR